MSRQEYSKVKLADVATLVNGRAYLMPELQDSGKYKIVRVGNFSGKDEWFYSDMELEPDKYCYKGDLLYKWACTFGPEIWNDKKTIYHYHIWKIVNDPERIDRDYLYYLLKAMTPYWLAGTHGSTMVHITKEGMEDNDITIPVSTGYQKTVARILRTIDDKIALSKKMMAELEDTARLIYDYWFTQFDFPDENGKPYRSSGGKMVYNETLKREIPEGWEAGLMSDLGSVVSGATPSTGDSSNYADEGIAWITPNDLSDNDSFMHISHGKRDVSGVGLASCSAVMMPAGSTIMSSRAPIGYLAVAETACCTNQGCKSLVADAGYPSYFNFFTVQRLMPLIRSQGAGTTFAEVSKEDFASVRLARPPKGMAERFEKSVLPLCEKSKRLQTETVELSSLRDWLLPMLMNGQVSISG
ncbi:restriction endonuclease subunit S [Adlercreutzia rubneri]